jgi:hypothetical protein
MTNSSRGLEVPRLEFGYIFGVIAFSDASSWCGYFLIFTDYARCCGEITVS